MDSFWKKGQTQVIKCPVIDPTKPVLIAGPTASGKSSLALALAQRHDGIIINADALQVYACWQVLTARPDDSDLAKAPHHLYGHTPCDHKYSVGHWLRQVKPLLDENQNRLPIIVGGTGLYFTSLTKGLVDIPDVQLNIRSQSETIIGTGHIHEMIDDLFRNDPETHAIIDLQNPARVARAWEVLKSTGRGLADWQKDTPAALIPLDRANAFVVNAPKEDLTPRIEKRFRQMLDMGALNECRANMADWSGEHPSARAIGAAELMDHLKGELELEQAIERAVIATRQYAKRQRSWFRARMKDWNWLDMGQ